ncbi:cellulose biosynthesis cyclic di-GMP-binding regulatory protein BcsB [Arthrobacter zhaoguopingii]|uniref:cellulose biosynthesis cyclic di-GMP-binding regulatory protein BcsB n=1 Tax=Arthrobacter zhaoguopingii TaxID=2681491 RepID=UPI001FE5549E|nr:cellulose biosynthesis cyclic di-GMP-binding regulatory protein BcsB [Arthrobacter zhaoguopingii]
MKRPHIVLSYGPGQNRRRLGGPSREITDYGPGSGRQGNENRVGLAYLRWKLAAATRVLGLHGRIVRRFLAASALFSYAATFALLAANSASAEQFPAEDNHGSVTAMSGQSEQQLILPLIAGHQPTRLKGTISLTGQPAGAIRLSVPGRVLLETPAAAKIPVDLALTPADVNGQQLVLGLQYVPGPRTSCGDPSSEATLSGISIVTAGTEALPSTVADFLSPSVPAILIPVPEDPEDDVSIGILAVSAAVANRYPDAQVIAIPESETAAQSPNLPAGSRIIRVSADSGTVSTKVTVAYGRPTLVLAGQGDELRMAAMALASDNSALADDAAVSGMTTSLPSATGLEHSLSALGAPDVKLSGYGTQEAYVGVNQAQFGGPVSSLSLRVRGTHTAVPTGGAASISVYWNDYILSSQALEGDSFRIEAEVPSGHIQAMNGLRIRLTATPPGGDCAGPTRTLPMEMTLDTAGSHITGERGHSVAPGFARFPQVLGGSLPVAFDRGASTQTNTLNAATLVTSLQRQAAGLLEVRRVGLDDFLESSDSGLLVGATPDTANRLSAPLRLAEFRTVSAGDLSYSVGTSAPYGALEAFEHDGRNILMLGAWAPDSDTESSQRMQRSLTAFVQEQDGGWASLSRNLLLTQTSGEPVMLENQTVIPQRASTDTYRPYALWLGVVVGGLGSVLLLRVWLGRRHRDLARSYADARQNATGADSHPDD